MLYVFHQCSSGRGPLQSSMEAMLEALNADWCAGSYFTTFCEQSGNQVLQHHSRYIWCLSQCEETASLSVWKCTWTNIFIVVCVVPAVGECGSLLGWPAELPWAVLSGWTGSLQGPERSTGQHTHTHTQEPLQWGHFCGFFFNFTVYAQSAHFFKR